MRLVVIPSSPARRCGRAVAVIASSLSPHHRHEVRRLSHWAYRWLLGAWRWRGVRIERAVELVDSPRGYVAWAQGASIGVVALSPPSSLLARHLVVRVRSRTRRRVPAVVLIVPLSRWRIFVRQMSRWAH